MKKIVQLALLMTIISAKPTHSMDWSKNKWNSFSASLSNASRTWYQNLQEKTAAFKEPEVLMEIKPYRDLVEVSRLRDIHENDIEIRSRKEMIGVDQKLLQYAYSDEYTQLLTRSLEENKKELQSREYLKSAMQSFMESDNARRNARRNEARKLRFNRFFYPSTAKESLKQREKFGLGYE